MADDGVAIAGQSNNFWLAKNKQAGGDEGFILDFGSTKRAVGVRLKNTHNRWYRDRGTKRFSLFGSNNPNGPWKKILDANLEDPRRQYPPKVKTLHFGNAVNIRFLKFQLLDFYGNGGGLQHLAVLT